MAKVSTDGMRGTAGEIKSLIDILKNRATSTAMGAERMSQAASILTGYNGQIVQGTVVNTNQFDGKHVSHYKEYQTWIINTNGVEELASSVAKKAEALGTIASKISGEADVINSISEQIEGYIATIQSTIGDNVSATAAATAFKALGQNGVTKANLAVSGDLINNRDFLDFNQIKTDPNLQGGVLTFEKQDDGTYKVLKNGGGTGYYTTGLAAAFYMKTLSNTLKSENAGYEMVQKYHEQQAKSTEKAGDEMVQKYHEQQDKSTEKTGDEMVQKYHEQQAKLTEKAGDEMVQKYHEQQDKSSEKAGDEMVQKYHEQQAKSTEISEAEFVKNLETKEQYTFNNQKVENGKTVQTYKGQSGGYKLVEPLDSGDSRVTYYDKNDKYIYSTIFDENGNIN